jgi:hypothetical protein
VQASPSIITDQSTSIPSQPQYLLPIAPEKNNNFAAKNDSSWDTVRKYRDSLDNESPTETAHRYFAKYPNYPPDRFNISTSKRKKAAKAALLPVGWASRLLKQLGYPNIPAYFYTLSAGNLGLPIDYSDPRYLYASTVIDEIKAAIAKHIPQPYHWRVEVGTHGTLHVHAIGPHAPALAHLAHPNSLRVQAIRPGTELRPFAYLHKPVALWTASNYGIYLQAKATKQTKALPNLSGQLGIKKSRRGTA